MSLTTKTTSNLLNTVNQIALNESIQNSPQAEPQVETTEVLARSENELNDIAEAFLYSVLGDSLNESTEQNDQRIVELVEQLNAICFAVNEYFGVQD